MTLAKHFRRVPTAVALALVAGILVKAMQPSAAPQVLGYSYFRFVVILVLATVALYLAVSLWRVPLIAFNNWAIYAVATGLILTELLLHAFPILVPTSLIPYLPWDARAMLAGERGFFTDEVITGSGLLYAFRPRARLAWAPWAEIDGDGFRNRTQPSQQVDVVFLGDSVTLALGAEEDLADRFRGRGLSTLSLAMAGYGPFQYRDAFQRYVIDRGLKARDVVVLICGDNDLPDSVNYVRVKEQGGNYRDYLGTAPTLAFGNVHSRYVPWVVALAANLMPTVKKVLTGEATLANGVVRLGYARLAAGSGVLSRDPVGRDDLTWRLFAQAMGEVLELVRGSGARALVAYYPPPRLIFGPHLEGFDAFKAQVREDHDALMALMREAFVRPGVAFVDLADFVSTVAYREDIGAEPLNYHLNGRGAEIVAAKLFDELAALNRGLARTPVHGAIVTLSPQVMAPRS